MLLYKSTCSLSMFGLNSRLSLFGVPSVFLDAAQILVGACSVNRPLQQATRPRNELTAAMDACRGSFERLEPWELSVIIGRHKYPRIFQRAALRVATSYLPIFRHWRVLLIDICSGEIADGSAQSTIVPGSSVYPVIYPVRWARIA